MFGLSILETYFFINMIYTLILFFFFHNKLINRAKDRYETSNNSNDIEGAITIFYITSIFLGSVKLVKDLLTFLFLPDDSLWLYNGSNREKND